MKLFKLTAVVIALMLGHTAHAAANVNTNIEMNNLWVTDIGITQVGRVEVNLDNKKDKDTSFVAARASLIAKHNGDAKVDDMWIQLGNSTGALKLGRFESTDLFPLGVTSGGAGFGGSGANLVTAGNNQYRANTLRGRDISGAMSDSFHGELTFNAGLFGVELGMIESKNKVGQLNFKGIRPVITTDLGALKIAAGAEVIETFNGLTTESDTGFGITAGFNAGEGKFNLNYARKSLNGIKNTALGFNGSVGAVGMGVVLDKETKQPNVTTVYGSYAMPLYGIPGATITPAVSYSKASGGSSVNAANIRLNYEF